MLEDNDVCLYERLLLSSDVDLIQVGIEFVEVTDFEVRGSLEYLEDSLTRNTSLGVSVGVDY